MHVDIGPFQQKKKMVVQQLFQNNPKSNLNVFQVNSELMWSTLTINNRNIQQPQNLVHFRLRPITFIYLHYIHFL